MRTKKKKKGDFLGRPPSLPPSSQPSDAVSEKGNGTHLNYCTVQGNLIKNIHIRISVGLPI